MFQRSGTPTMSEEGEPLFNFTNLRKTPLGRTPLGRHPS
jgi:hypothetical protein